MTIVSMERAIQRKYQGTYDLKWEVVKTGAST